MARSRQVLLPGWRDSRCHYGARQGPSGGGDKALDAAHWLAVSYLANKEPQAATRLLNQLAGTGSGPFALQLELDRADALYDDPQTRRQALDRYAALADQHPESDLAPQARYLAAYAALELHDYDSADAAKLRPFSPVIRNSNCCRTCCTSKPKADCSKSVRQRRETVPRIARANIPSVRKPNCGKSG